MYYSEAVDGSGDRWYDGTTTSYPEVAVRSYHPFESFIEISDELLLAIAAAEKDRLYWSFKVLLVWSWVYMPFFLLLVLRLMISLSGWLGKVGKKIIVSITVSFSH